MDGDLAPYLLACRFKFATVGLAGCTLDTSAPGVYTIQFAVENSAGLRATASRNVTVLITCAPPRSKPPLNFEIPIGFQGPYSLGRRGLRVSRNRVILHFKTVV